MSENKKYKILNKKGPENSVLTLEVEVDKDFVESFRNDTVSDLKKDLEVDGFRKGNAPETKVVEEVGELKIWEKNTYKAINIIVPVILQEEKINTISMPNISVTKLALQTSPEIKIELTLMPEVDLADYKKIAGDVAKPKVEEVTDKEVDDYIDYIRQNRAQATCTHDHKPGEKCENEKELPELNDEFVKSLGEFKSVEDFKKQIKENLGKDKQLNSEQKRRIEIMEKIITGSKIEIPDVLIEEEQERMLHEFKAKVESFKMNFEDYLKEIKKTEEDLKKEWRADSEKRAKMNLILPKIAREEDIRADEDEIEKEVKTLKEHHPQIDETMARVYVTNVLTNQKVFDYLDKL